MWVISGKYKQVHGNLSRNLLDEVIENDVIFGLNIVCLHEAYVLMYPKHI